MPLFSKSKKSQPPKRSSKLRIVFRAFSAAMLLLLITLVIFIGIAAAGTPAWDPAILDNQKQTSYLYDQNNVQYGALPGAENSEPINFSDIPDLVINTFIAVEDKRFNDHIGIDPIRIVGSAINNIRSRSSKEGASTITAQLARNAFIEDPMAKTYTRKIQEAILALQIEHAYTKEEIITFYLNRIFFGESSFGIKVAAKTYFGEGDLTKLTPDQVALLVGLPQAPSGYNPYVNPEAAKNRRTVVLGVMRDADIITAQEFDEYKDAPFTYVEAIKNNEAQKTYATSYEYPYFTDFVIHELEKTYNLTEEQVFSGGLRIYTTVNPKVQETAEAAFADSNNFPKGIDKVKVQGAITVIEPSTGAVQAMVGGRDYTTRGLNRAWQSPRQPGSTIKPLVAYAPALEKGGYFPGTVFDDMPVKYGNFEPTNFDTLTKGWKGLITMRYALEQSVNVYAVKLLNDIGVDYGWNFGKYNLGLPLQETERNLTLALGTPIISTLDMTAAYGTFANNGVSVTSHAIVKVEDAKGNIIVDPTITRNRVMKETTAYLINDMLRSVVTNGTGTSAQIGNWAIAGKTGTTSLDPDLYGNKTGSPDAWFAGYTPYYAAVVWMGYDIDEDREHYLRGVYGGGPPAKIWKKVMTAAHKDLPVQSKFTEPLGIISGTFDRKSGLLPSKLTPTKFISTEIAAEGDFPTKYSNIWIQKEVDANFTNMLASEFSHATITKTYLNLPDRDPSLLWPAEEAPYRPPSKLVPNPSTIPDQDDKDDDNDDNKDKDDNDKNKDKDKDKDKDDSKKDPEHKLSAPQLGTITYNAKSFKATVPMTIPSENIRDSIIFYVQYPGQDNIISFPVTASNSTSTSISVALSRIGKPAPGEYTIWAVFKNSSGIGPPSNNVKLTIGE